MLASVGVSSCVHLERFVVIFVLESSFFQIMLLAHLVFCLFFFSIDERKSLGAVLSSSHIRIHIEVIWKRKVPSFTPRLMLACRGIFDFVKRFVRKMSNAKEQA